MALNVSFMAGAATPATPTPIPAGADTIALDGLWRFQLDPMGFGMTPGSELYLSYLPETIVLPGSTDTGGKGIKNSAAYVDRLSRKYEYSGPAWYQREVTVPAGWTGRDVELELERCHWITTVYVDGREVGKGERLSSPNRWDLTEYLTPGTHTLTVCVDNRSPYAMDQWAHGITEYTQTNWNGIVGDMNIIGRGPNRIKSLRIYPDATAKSARIEAGTKLLNYATLRLAVADASGKTVASKEVSVAAADSIVTADIEIGRNARLWDEFDPYLYTLTATIVSDGTVADSRSDRFGLRNVEQGRNHIRINGVDRHLRGTLDCGVWPLTGYPATDKESWKKVMQTAADYGMNHIRFHSWCPPEAAFDAADELGLYLQVELPMWIKDVGQYPDRRDFFEREMYALLDEYGNHPSFVLYCNGNENEGDFAVLEDLIRKGMAHDPRHLYSASTARTHVDSDQYYVSHVSPKGWITVYEGRPSTDWDVNANSDIDVPVIAHETGQRCMYPDFDEMSKYTGVLEPRNMGVFRDRLARNGMLHQAADFLDATGRHTVLQYKAVNEALLGSDKSGGYQLLGLQDFPGQGSAFVGILDAFWESKGLVTPEVYRESNGPEVILARMPKRVYRTDEPFEAKISVYNFGRGARPAGNAEWRLESTDGTIAASGRIKHGKVERSTVDSIGRISASLDGIDLPGRYTLHVADGKLHNSWDIWVYPASDRAKAEISYVSDVDSALSLLAEGKKVLLIPADAPGRKTKFASHFWNPIMFNWNPMIVGTLIDSDHGSLAGFPTDNYADWQWTDVLNNGRALDLTPYRNLTPVIQSIDTYEENRKLGIAFEARVGDGSLYVLCVDPIKNITERPATARLLRSVADYVSGDSFKPETVLAPHQVKAIFAGGEEGGDGSMSEAARQLLNR